MKFYGYKRVSTERQDIGRQTDALNNFQREHNVTIEKHYSKESLWLFDKAVMMNINSMNNKKSIPISPKVTLKTERYSSPLNNSELDEYILA